jgi:hypothetical protein
VSGIKFSPGSVVATPGASQALRDAGDDPKKLSQQMKIREVKKLRVLKCLTWFIVWETFGEREPR